MRGQRYWLAAVGAPGQSRGHDGGHEADRARAASTSSSRSPAAAATSTRSTTRPGTCSSTGACSRPPSIRPTTASSPTRSARTATRSTRSCCSRTRRSPACWVEARPVGVMWMQDEAGPDAKIICVPPGEPRWNDVEDIARAARPACSTEIEHFFDIYKTLEPGKSSTTRGFEGRDAAWAEIRGVEAPLQRLTERPDVRVFISYRRADSIGVAETRSATGWRTISALKMSSSTSTRSRSAWTSGTTSTTSCRSATSCWSSSVGAGSTSPTSSAGGRRTEGGDLRPRPWTIYVRNGGGRRCTT